MPRLEMPPDPDALGFEPGADIARALRALAAVGRLKIDPDTVERDLARLLLGLMEFPRQLMKLQALRRFEAGSLTETRQGALGQPLMRSADALRGLPAVRFGLQEGDRHLELGPLGKLT